MFINVLPDGKRILFIVVTLAVRLPIYAQTIVAFLHGTGRFKLFLEQFSSYPLGDVLTETKRITVFSEVEGVLSPGNQRAAESIAV